MSVADIAKLLSSRPAAPRAGYRTHKSLRIADYLGLWRQRQDLKKLDAHLLRDIGVDAGDAHSESSRPIWDVPQHWKR